MEPYWEGQEGDYFEFFSFLPCISLVGALHQSSSFGSQESANPVQIDPSAAWVRGGVEVNLKEEKEMWHLVRKIL